MKVVHIITCLDIGGAETMLTRLLLAADDPSCGQLVISLKDLGPLGSQLRQAGVTVETIGLGHQRGMLRGCWFLFRLLRRHQPDIVQTWLYHADFLGGLIAWLAGCRKIVWGIRGTFTPIGRPWTHRIMQCCARLSSWLPARILCVAEAARQSHIQYGYTADKMAVIGNGLDLIHFDQAKQPQVDWCTLANWQEKLPVLGCVGRYHPDKGQDLFIAAIAELHLRVPQLRFVMVGRDCDQHNQALTQQITDLGLTGMVYLAGERRDIPACLAGFDYFCLPSRTEGFPNVLAEAMAAGVPAVACDVGDVAVLAADSVILVEAGRHQAIRDGLLELLARTPERLALQSKAARERIETHCSIRAVRQQYEHFYQQMLES